MCRLPAVILHIWANLLRRIAYCEAGRRSSLLVAVLSRLEMGPTEQRQYFTVGWQAAAKVFTALLQCGKMDPGRETQVRSLRKIDSVDCVSLSRTTCIAWIVARCVFVLCDYVEQCLTAGPAHILTESSFYEWMRFPFSPLLRSTRRCRVVMWETVVDCCA